MRRREFIALFGSAVTWPLAVRAQGKTAHVLYLAELSPDSTPHLLKAFRDQLHVLGWDEGRNLTITYRSGLQSFDGLARDLETLKPDVVVAWTTPIVAAAQRVTKTLPIVMVGIADPIEAGFVVSLAHPGGNITGTTNLARDLGGKLLDLLAEVVPTANSVTVLRNLSNPASSFQFREISDAGERSNHQIVAIDVSSDAELESAFARMKREGSKAVVVLADTFFLSNRARIAELERDSRLPIVFARGENVVAGGLMSYGPNLSGQFHDTADYVDKILKGANPSELPVQLPTKLELIINLKTAKAIGLALPPRLLVRADEVIE